MLLQRSYHLQSLATIALGVVVANSAASAQWSADAAVATALVYTDNICRTQDDKQGQLVGTVTPSTAIRADGNRANFSLSASVEVNSLTDSKLDDLGCNPQGLGDREQFAPKLTGTADAVLIEDWLFLDVKANIDQNSVDPFLSGDGDSLNTNGNTNTTYRYSVSPYISRRVKDVAVLDIRYTWDDQYNSTDTVGDSSEESAQLSLTSAPGVSNFSIGLQGDYSKIEYDDRPGAITNADNELTSVQLNLGYQLNRRWQINGFYGEERNDFVSNTDDIDGIFWDVGLRWTPSSRTTVEVGTGDRFFGSTPRFSVSHQYRRSVFSASYAKTLTYDRNIRTFNDGVDFTPIGGPTTLSNSPIIDERFTLGYSYQGRRFGASVSASQSDQTRSEDGRDSSNQNVTLSVNRSLSRLMSVSSSLSWREDDPQGLVGRGSGQSETLTFNLGVQRPLGDNTNLSLDYQYEDRQAGNSAVLVSQEYQENRLTLTLSHSF